MKKLAQIAILATLIALPAGCAHQQVFSMADGRIPEQDRFQQDTANCNLITYSLRPPLLQRSDVFRLCMIGKGYAEVQQ